MSLLDLVADFFLVTLSDFKLICGIDLALFLFLGQTRPIQLRYCVHTIVIFKPQKRHRNIIERHQVFVHYICSATRLSLCLTAAAHAFSNIHTRTGISGPQPIRGGVRPSPSLIGLDHDMSLERVCFWTTGRLSESLRLFFFTAGRTGSDVWVWPNWSHSRALEVQYCKTLY